MTRRLEDMKLLKTGQVAERLGVSRENVRSMCAAGKLPAVKIGSQYRVPEDEFASWLEDQRVKPFEDDFAGPLKNF